MSMGAGMQREGSPWSGLGVVFLKELSDHLTSIRMTVLGLTMVVTAFVAVFFATMELRPDTGTEVFGEDKFVFLRLFTQAHAPVPPFVWFLSLLVPLIAIGLGFDLVNSEHSRRTLSRILAQPIYRDALLFGKFLAALTTIAINLLALWLLVIGLGLVRLGVPPGVEELGRAFFFLGVTIVYAGVWLALAMVFSIIFRSPATAALLPLGIWLFLTFLWPRLSPVVAASFTPGIASAEDLLGAIGVQQAFARLSPSALFGEVTSVVLDPSVRSTQQPVLASLGLALVERGAIPGAPIAFVQSLLIVWAQIVGLVAGTILLFVAGYVVFQRQEVRA
jgi:ABC-2 type transport system permease protein